MLDQITKNFYKIVELADRISKINPNQDNRLY